MILPAIAMAMALAGDAPAPPHPRIIVEHRWAARPSAADMSALYPPAARDAGVEGLVVISCIATAEGKLSACEAVVEKPAGMGFGEASLKLAEFFRLEPADARGKPIEGASIRLPIRWKPAV